MQLIQIKGDILKNISYGKCLLRYKGSTLDLRGRGYQGLCDNSTIALVIKSVTMGGEGVKNYHYCVTSFMGDPQDCFRFNSVINEDLVITHRI